MILFISDLLFKTCVFVSEKVYNAGYYMIYKETPLSKTDQLIMLQNDRFLEISNELYELRKLIKKE